MADPALGSISLRWLTGLGVALVLPACGAAPELNGPLAAIDGNRENIQTESIAEPLNVALEREDRDSSDPLQFDLVCNLRRRVVQDTVPTAYRGFPNAQSSSGSDRYIVDLRAMKFCYPIICKRYGPARIASVNHDWIMFGDRPGFTHGVRRRDGRLQVRLEENGRVTVTTGICIREGFSGFPDRVDGA